MTKNKKSIHKIRRKEHKKRVEEMVAQAIVQRTLDIERNRQFDIHKKLDEIKKIENVRKLKLSRIDVMRSALAVERRGDSYNQSIN